MSNNNNENKNVNLDEGEDIDDSLYSRQRYVWGDKAMRKMQNSNVFMSGCGSIGVEIAKNVCLAGVAKLTLHDSENASFFDLSGQFYLSENHIGQGRLDPTADKIDELNPYTKVSKNTDDIYADDFDMSFFDEYTCVVLTGAPLKAAIKINEYCRNKGIAFILADLNGALVSTFVDFGDKFQVLDRNGEQLKQVLVDHITNETPAVVHCLENVRHEMETGYHVEFYELPEDEEEGKKAWKECNEKLFRIKELTPFTFSLYYPKENDDDDDEEERPVNGEEFAKYNKGTGMAIEKKVPFSLKFKSLAESLEDPELIMADLCKFDYPGQLHLFNRALYEYRVRHEGNLPELWNYDQAKEVVDIATEINEKAKHVDEIKVDVFTKLALTARGGLAPLAAFMGGLVGQEVLKSITGKFTPTKQWLYVDGLEVLPEGSEKSDFDHAGFHPKDDRYDALRVCVGQNTVEAIGKLRLFMVGAGAIGCEMFKNFAMLGVATSGNGEIKVTDNDLIERSNLNRQFLFRTKHINEPKSTSAKEATLEMNPQLKITTFLDKVGGQTEEKYNDAFYSDLDLIVNALDNVEARKYMDSRAVTNQKFLLESGTLGPKGHIQVVIPFESESYGSSNDPPEKDVPYCTLKSFPSNINHCIVWSRDLLFEDLLVLRPSDLKRFTEDKDIKNKVKNPDKDLWQAISKVAYMVDNKPNSYSDCISLARILFEEHYRNSALTLLNKFPLDHKMKDGSLFWSSPKRPPTPLTFDPSDTVMMNFIKYFSILYGQIWGIKPDIEDDSDYISVLDTVEIPEFVIDNNVKIAVDEDDEKAKEKEEEISEDKQEEFRSSVEKYFTGDNIIQTITPHEFEKDVDENHHIDFITAAANLRARLYKIKEETRIEVKRIAGRITPAIATTTSAVSGLVSLELIKIAQKSKFENYKSCFLNLGIAFITLSEPGVARKREITKKITCTIWDRFEVKKAYTLQDLIRYFKLKMNLQITGIVFQGQMIYVSSMPQHKDRLPQPMKNLLKRKPGTKYADLVVSFTDENGKKVDNPPVTRFYFRRRKNNKKRK